MSTNEDVLSITRTQAVISSVNHIAITLGIAGNLLSIACDTIKEANERFDVDDDTAARIISLVSATVMALLGRLSTVHETAVDEASSHADKNVTMIARAALTTVRSTLSEIESIKKLPETGYVDIDTARRIAGKLVTTAQAVLCILMDSAAEPEQNTPPVYLN
jgi:hypothetical protein